MQVNMPPAVCGAAAASAPPCPWCGQPGKKVPQVTVESLTGRSLAGEEGQFSLCLSPACRVAYYGSNGTVILKDELKVKIWFKEESPVPICYCRGVTDQEILRHVAEEGCCSTLEEIKAHTGAGTGGRCLWTNPGGT